MSSTGYSLLFVAVTTVVHSWNGKVGPNDTRKGVKETSNSAAKQVS